MKKFVSICLIFCLILASSFSSLAATSNNQKTTESIVTYKGIKYDLSTLKGAKAYFQDTGKIESLFQNVSEDDLEDIKKMLKDIESTSSTSYSDSSMPIMSVVDGPSTRAVDGPPRYNLETKLQANADSMITTYELSYATAIQSNDPVTAASIAYLATGVYFADKVKIGGVWDYKQDLGWNNEYKVYIDGGYSYMFGEDIGNVHYGYVGKTYFPSLMLQSLAGLVQIAGGEVEASWYQTYFDDPNDNIAIKAGIEYYDTGSFEW